MIAPLLESTLEDLRRLDSLDRARSLRAQIERAQNRNRRRATLTLRDGSKLTGWLLGGCAALDVESGCGFGLVCIVTEDGQFRDLPYAEVETCGPAETSEPAPTETLQAMLAAYRSRFGESVGDGPTHERT